MFTERGEAKRVRDFVTADRILAELEADGVGRVSTRSKRRRPLHFAARNGQLDVVQHLCEVAGADPDLVRVS